jgi:hypothetical protein
MHDVNMLPTAVQKPAHWSSSVTDTQEHTGSLSSRQGIIRPYLKNNVAQEDSVVSTGRLLHTWGIVDLLPPKFERDLEQMSDSIMAKHHESGFTCACTHLQEFFGRLDSAEHDIRCNELACVASPHKLAS